MAERFPSASLVENVRFNEAVIVANAVQGLFRRRRTPVAAATRFDVDARAVGLLHGLRERHGGRPVWVKVVRDDALLLLDVADVRRVLEGSPHPFASDPEAKRQGMAHFQPDALTISRGELWEQRRAFTDDVMARAATLTDRFVAAAEQEVGAALEGGVLDQERLHAAYRRLTRRVVLGDAAAQDEELSELLGTLMDQANGRPGERSAEFEPFRAKLAAYYAAAEDGSLAGLAAAAHPAPDVRADGQLAHWLFAMQDTLSANALRALAVLAAHPAQLVLAEAEVAKVRTKRLTGKGVAGLARTRAALLEAMRLWPTTPLLSREILADLTWHGVRVPAGTNVLICNTFMHRDPGRLGDAADRFTPDGWLDGGAFTDDWGLNFFSHGPQGCPGAELSLTLGTATLATVLRAGRPTLERPRLDATAPLPHMLDVFGVSVSV